MTDLPAAPETNADYQSPFERIRRVDADGNEIWSARDLVEILQYANYFRFKNVLLKAQLPCENCGHDPSDHFYHAVTMVAIGASTKREVEDMHLARYACHLVVQNADPSKEVVALGQTYFAVQTRHQGLAASEALGELTGQDDIYHANLCIIAIGM